MAELKTMLEDKWGVKAAAAAVAVAAPAAGGAAPAAAAEASDFKSPWLKRKRQENRHY